MMRKGSRESPRASTQARLEMTSLRRAEMNRLGTMICIDVIAALYHAFPSHSTEPTPSARRMIFPLPLLHGTSSS
jgi:hypothetical protein